MKKRLIVIMLCAFIFSGCGSVADTTTPIAETTETPTPEPASDSGDDFISDLLDDSDEPTEKEYKKMCKKYKYAKLRQYPKKYKGKKIKVTGIIISAKRAPLGAYYWLTVNAKFNFYRIRLDILNAQHDEYVEGNKIRVWGECRGNAKVKVNGKRITVPDVKARYDDLWYLDI